MPAVFQRIDGVLRLVQDRAALAMDEQPGAGAGLSVCAMASKAWMSVA